MHTELKKMWINDLRQNTRIQGRAGLRSINDKFCCLGRLCNIIDPNAWTYKDNSSWYQFHNEVSILPTKLLPLINITSYQEGQLIIMNDDGKTFTEIANWIEVNL